MLADDSAAPDRELDRVASVSFKSRVSLTPEEQAVIPADGTRDWSKWKMRTRAGR